MNYIIKAEGMEYFWAGTYIGFTSVREGALKYVSLEIAETAAKAVYALIKSGSPKCKKLVAEKF